MIFPNISFFHMIVTYWTGPLNPVHPKQLSNWIILVPFCSSHLAIKNDYNVHFMKIQKIDAKIDFSAKNSKKFVYYNEELVHNFNISNAIISKTTTI